MKVREECVVEEGQGRKHFRSLQSLHIDLSLPVALFESPVSSCLLYWLDVINCQLHTFKTQFIMVLKTTGFLII